MISGGVFDQGVELNDNKLEVCVAIIVLDIAEAEIDILAACVQGGFRSAQPIEGCGDIVVVECAGDIRRSKSRQRLAITDDDSGIAQSVDGGGECCRRGDGAGGHVVWVRGDKGPAGSVVVEKTEAARQVVLDLEIVRVAFTDTDIESIPDEFTDGRSGIEGTGLRGGDNGFVHQRRCTDSGRALDAVVIQYAGGREAVIAATFTTDLSVQTGPLHLGGVGDNVTGSAIEDTLQGNGDGRTYSNVNIGSRRY